MPLFTRSVDFGTPFKKNDTVKATVDLPGVPAGTEGRIKVINGFEWTRYWVFFDNGVDLSHLDGGELVRPQHWQDWHDAQAAAAEAAERAAEAAEAAAEGGEAAATDSAAADPNDPLAAVRAMVPPHLLERSAAARARLTGG
ncbi:MAG: hypothetical protein AAF567_13365 [Actinomycetota bacterium]